jgi:hypothetical protein
MYKDLEPCGLWTVITSSCIMQPHSEETNQGTRATHNESVRANHTVTTVWLCHRACWLHATTKIGLLLPTKGPNGPLAKQRRTK